MNLQEDFNMACNRVSDLLVRREELVKSLTNIQSDLAHNSKQIEQAIKSRDDLREMLSVVPSTPEKRKYTVNKNLMENRQSVFKALRKVPDHWVTPQALAIMSDVEESITASILRRAVKIGIPSVKHNGKRGRGSMYRWVSTDA